MFFNNINLGFKKKTYISLAWLSALIIAFSSTIADTVNAAYDARFFESNSIGMYLPGVPCEEGSEGESGGASIAGSDNEEKIWNWLKEKDMSDAGAAGIMGNLAVESAFNPFRLQVANETWESLQDSGPNRAFGLAQWDSDRRPQVLQYIVKDNEEYKKYVSIEYGGEADSYKKAPEAVNDDFINLELEFLEKESKPGGSRSTVWDLMLKASNPGSAADTFEEIFEGSVRTAGGTHYDEAVRVFDKYKGNSGGGVTTSANSGESTECEGEGGSESIDQGGLTLDQAKKFVMNYGANKGGDSAQFAGALWPFCEGGGANCVTFSYFFNNKFTNLPAAPNHGNGEAIVGNLGNAGAKTGNKPKVFSTFSWDNGGYGHTGIVLGIHGDEVVVGHASCSSGSPGQGDGTTLGAGAAIARSGKLNDSQVWLGQVPVEFAYPDKVDTNAIEDYVNGKI